MRVLQFGCSGCQKIITLKDLSFAGKKIRCPKCQTVAHVIVEPITIPFLQGQEPTASDEAPTPADTPEPELTPVVMNVDITFPTAPPELQIELAAPDLAYAAPEVNPFEDEDLTVLPPLPTTDPVIIGGDMGWDDEDDDYPIAVPIDTDENGIPIAHWVGMDTDENGIPIAQPVHLALLKRTRPVPTWGRLAPLLAASLLLAVSAGGFWFAEVPAWTTAFDTNSAATPQTRIIAQAPAPKKSVPQPKPIAKKEIIPWSTWYLQPWQRPRPIPTFAEAHRIADELQYQHSLKIERALRQHLKDESILPPNYYGSAPALARFVATDTKFNVVAFSPDCQFVAAGATDRSVRVWELATGRLIHDLQGHEDEVLCMAFTADAKMLATGAKDGLIILWDLDASIKRTVLPRQARAIRTMAFSRDQTTLFTGGSGMLHAWNINTNKMRWGYLTPQHRFAVDHLALSTDGNVILTGGHKQLVFWNSHSGQPFQTLDVPGPLTHMIWSRDNRKLIVAGGDSIAAPLYLQVHDLHAGKHLDMAGGFRSLGFVDMSPDGRTLYISGVKKDGFAEMTTVVDLPSGQIRKLVDRGRGLPAKLRLSPAGVFVAAISPYRASFPVCAVADLPDQATTAYIDTLKSWCSIRWRPEGYHADVHGKATATNLRKLRQLPRLAGLNLQYANQVNYDSLSALKELPRLQDLNLKNCYDLTDAALNRLKHVPHLRVLDLTGVDRLTDAGLERLRQLSELRSLTLANLPSITHVGMSHIASLKQLRKLSLARTAVTSVGLRHLQELTQLQELSLKELDLDDVALQYLSKSTELRRLDLTATGITSDGCRHLRKLTQLRQLHLGENKVTSRGLAALWHMTDLEELHLNDSRVRDLGLEYLEDHIHLKKLNLSHTNITDAGLASLTAMNQLEELSLRDIAGIKGHGLKYLRKLPNLRRLDLHNTDVDDTSLSALDDLNQLESLILPATITDNGFVHLRRLTNLHLLEVRGLQKLQGRGLQHLNDLHKLHELNLSGTGVTNEGLSYLKYLPQLKYLHLPKHVDDTGLANLKHLKQLQSLNLYHTAITDRGLTHLTELPSLRILDLTETKITNDSLPVLQKLPQIRELVLTGTGITEDAVNQLQVALPALRVTKY